MTIHDEDAESARLADELAAEFGRDEAKLKPATTAAPTASRPSRTPWIIAAVSLTVVLAQIPTLRASLAPKASLHVGVQVSDPATEACIDTLWAMSALVQEGESAEAIARLPFAEPTTHLAYRVTLDHEEELVVECPNPQLHGLKRLQVTASRPIPEALR